MASPLPDTVSPAQPEHPIGLEDQRVEGVVAVSEAPGAPSSWGVGAVAALLAVAVAAIAVATLPEATVSAGSPPAGAAGADDHQVERPHGSAPAPAGISLTGLAADGDSEYDPVASRRLGLHDRLRIAWSNPRADLRWLVVFGAQPGRPLIWYQPAAERKEPFHVSQAQRQPLPGELRVAAGHAPGLLRIVAVLTSERPDLPDLRRRLAAAPDDLGVSLMESRVRALLDLAREDVVQVLETHVVEHRGGRP